jgi:hypothetical protein
METNMTAGGILPSGFDPVEPDQARPRSGR